MKPSPTNTPRTCAAQSGTRIPAPQAQKRPPQQPKPTSSDINYDGYYEDVPTDDNGHMQERFDPAMMKQIALVAAGALGVIILAIVIMSLL